MVEIKTGDMIIGDSSEHWIFGGYVNENTISIIYYKRKYQHFTHTHHSFSSNYYYCIEIGTRINLPHSEKKTYVAKMNQKDNVICLSAKPIN